MDSPKRNLEITWPLFGDSQPFPADPERTVNEFEPLAADLAALKTSAEPPDSSERIVREVRQMRESLPPNAPEWMQAARALADWLEIRIKRGQVAPTEEAAIARTWAAFSLGGVTNQQVFKIARVEQRAPRVAYMGPPRSFSHAAALRLFGEQTEYIVTRTIPDAVDAASEGQADLAIVPIENTIEGGVNATLDALFESDLTICAEFVLEVELCLLAQSADLSQIQRVASHPQPLGQCKQWLRRHLPEAELV